MIYFSLNVIIDMSVKRKLINNVNVEWQIDDFMLYVFVDDR